jgi:ABC-type multidrug transport system ATPase subunit
VKYEEMATHGQQVTDHRKPATYNQPFPASGIPYRLITEPYKHFSIAAPYMELIEEMTANEFLSFHAAFKPLIADNKMILEETGLIKSAVKQIRYFSSGMKQRLKLAQAFFSDTPVLLLDEPTTNLDADGIALYHSLIIKYGTGRLVIVSSNDEQEYDFCKDVIRIGDYK